MKIKNGNTKWMLREIVKDMIGDQVALAPKRALQTPQREWIANELNAFVEAKIKQFAENNFVNKEKIMGLWNDYKNGNQENSFYIWQWINLNEMLS